MSLLKTLKEDLEVKEITEKESKIQQLLNVSVWTDDDINQLNEVGQFINEWKIQTY